MNKMIYILLSAVGALLVSINSYGQSDSLVSVKVVIAGFDTETFADVSCDMFDHTFKNEKKYNAFSKKSELQHFISLLKEFKSVKALRSFDVRGSVSYNYSKVSNKYCFDTFGYFFKDGKYYFNRNLVIYIQDKVYGNHPKYLDTLTHHE
ncbi:hypothetical protein HQ865_22840 [Mucilaginibacter mali]|uniref:Uncharacterized protein n=1 Tax=Mucilaginibacter mali TaxID=2740462 RepID=A0A7D4UDC8_9SPHI|nr:hypothetical protein [Mucilaginibacter mali]QKJ32478.1 hypothetical protein HQ865_22840 [Mucilaginibacter mali]